MSTRTIAVATVARSDFGLYESVLRAIKSQPGLTLRLLASGAHYGKDWGNTLEEIHAAGFEVENGLEMQLVGDTPASVAKSLGNGVMAFAQAFANEHPDILLVLGDRSEMLCPVVASLPFNIPIAHLYGGKVTEGAIDERVRHAITKMSHLHFVACEEYRQRLLQLGEEEWRVFNFGAPGLDRIHDYQRSTRESLCAEIGLDPKKEFILTTYHPVTLEAGTERSQMQELLAVLQAYDGQIVMTYPNADVGCHSIIEMIEEFAALHKERVRIIKNAGTRLYFDLLEHAAAMIGNSSSGIGEAPSFKLPAVNIGTRQDGAVRADNIIDVGYEKKSIELGLRRALSSEFMASLEEMQSPYGDGHAGEKIVEVLSEIAIDDVLLRKKFVDMEVEVK